MTIKDSSTHTAVKVGLVGYGWWGKTIARQLANSSWLELSAVAEVDAHVRSTMSSDPVLAGVEIFDSPEQLMAKAGLEAVVLCTPHQLHADQMMSAAHAGLHIFC